MRKLFILRGAMGSGKSTFIKENKLEDYTLNSDNIRLMFNSVEMSINYMDVIPQFNNKKVWNLLFEVLEERMSKGELTFIDAMNIYADDLSKYKKLAEKYRYRLYIVDFTDIEYDVLIDRNHQREMKKRVSEESIKRVYKALNKEKLSKSFMIIKPDEIYKYINTLPRNVDSYEKIHIFGDIHGCLNTVKKYFEKNYIRENELYIFLGDYFDRGLENVEMFNFIKEKLNNKNFIFLTGNHEHRLYKYACEDDYKLDYDLKKTLEEFEGKVTKSEIRGLIKGLAQISYIEYCEKKYIINHGGIPYFPDKSLDFYSTNSYIYGIDKFDVNIDEIYNNYMGKMENKVIQIHGHRNQYKIDYNTYEYSYNLDGNIENGGYLRILVLNNDGTINYDEIKNDNFDPYLIEKENVYELVDNLRRNDYIFEKKLDNDISSFNFSKEAFYNKIWNNITTQSRGLFIDTNNYLVVARSYNKFFNLEERIETKYDNLKEKLEFPIKFYLKYNGFLGILSIHNDELLFCTKTQIDGKYCEYFKNIFYKIYDSNQIQSIKKRLIENNTSMVFEVIDSVNDKHIIEYKEDKLVLLDEIYNSTSFYKIDYNDLKKFANTNNIELKKLVYTANNIPEFEEIFDVIKCDDYMLDKEYIEGYVVEDNNDFMFKFKTEYYKKWKILRAKMEKFIKNNDFDVKDNDELTISFIHFIESKYKNKEISLDDINIIDERREFEKSHY